MTPNDYGRVSKSFRLALHEFCFKWTRSKSSIKNQKSRKSSMTRVFLRKWMPQANYDHTIRKTLNSEKLYARAARPRVLSWSELAARSTFLSSRRVSRSVSMTADHPRFTAGDNLRSGDQPGERRVQLIAPDGARAELWRSSEGHFRTISMLKILEFEKNWDRSSKKWTRLGID